jgi:hypothetical protein
MKDASRFAWHLHVVYVFCGYKVTQQEFDAVLHAFNRLTGSHYTQDDIAGVQIAPAPHTHRHTTIVIAFAVKLAAVTVTVLVPLASVTTKVEFCASMEERSRNG